MSLSNTKISTLSNSNGSFDKSGAEQSLYLGSNGADSNDIERGYSERTRRFGFDIGDLSFLVEESVYCELLVDHHITPLPNAPKHVAGLINLRGNIIPVYSLTTYVGANSDSEKVRYKYAYLIGKPEQGAALLINDKPRLVDLTEKQATASEGTELPELIRSSCETSYNIESQRWLSLKHDLLFSNLAQTL